MIVYHGGTSKVRVPDLQYTRDHADFGRGFYVTEDKDMACKWAARKSGECFVNKYELHLQGLKVITFTLSENWLDYISANRQFGSDHNGYNDKDVDVIIGPTADDKLFSSLKMYWKNYWTKEETMHCLNVAGFSNQIALKTPKALQAVKFIQCRELPLSEKDKWSEIANKERDDALVRMQELLKREWNNSELYERSDNIKEIRGDEILNYDDEPEL